MSSTMIEMMDQRSREDHYVEGTAVVARVGRVLFPVFELRQNDDVLASMGRAGVLKIMFGRGQRVSLRDGTRWRIQALGSAGAICPAILDSERRKIAISSPRGDGRYGLNGRDYGCVLYPAERRRFARANQWILRRHETEVATLTRYPLSIHAIEPVHLGAVFASFALMTHGIPGESAPRLNFRWDR